MKQLAAAPSVSEYELILLSGSDKGTRYKLPFGTVRIGRGNENDIVIATDLKMSRQHAAISITPEGCQITNISEKGNITVDGVVGTAFELKNGSLIKIGDMNFQIKFLSAKSDAALTDKLLAINKNLKVPGHSRSPNKMKSRQSGNSNNKKIRFYIIVGSIIVLFAWLMNSKVKHAKQQALRNDESVQQEIENDKKIIENANIEDERSGKKTIQYAEAQPNFVKGFRDYRRGQYERAIESFQACLSLFPQHAQCQRYLQLSSKKFSELIQYHMILASKYRAQNQFDACKAAYRNAMFMIKTPTDKVYAEAKAGYDACAALEGERY